jgi:hypothetical protein
MKITVQTIDANNPAHGRLRVKPAMMHLTADANNYINHINQLNHTEITVQTKKIEN